MKARGTGLIFQPTWKDRRTGEHKTSSIWWVQYNVRGKRIRENSKSSNRADAARLLKTRLAAVQSGKPCGPDVEKTTFADLGKMLENDYVANGHRSSPRLRNLTAFFAGIRAVEITSDRITAYARARLEAGAKNSSVNRELAALKRSFRLAAIAGKVANVPHCSMLREDNARKGFFELEQLMAILKHLPEYLQPVIKTAYITGWRVRSELLTRQKSHLNLVAGWIRLDPGESKNGAARMFPLTPELREVIESQVERNNEFERATGQIVQWLFHRKGKEIKGFRKAWISACDKAKLVGKIPHDFRRTAVRNLERAGVPRSTAMQLTGHKTESVYRRYAIVDEAMLQDGVAKLATLHALDKTNAAKKSATVVPMPTRQSA